VITLRRRARRTRHSGEAGRDWGGTAPNGLGPASDGLEPSAIPSAVTQLERCITNQIPGSMTQGSMTTRAADLFRRRMVAVADRAAAQLHRADADRAVRRDRASGTPRPGKWASWRAGGGTCSRPGRARSAPSDSCKGAPDGGGALPRYGALRPSNNPRSETRTAPFMKISRGRQRRR
jgi:hypothetical protein